MSGERCSRTWWTCAALLACVVTTAAAHASAAPARDAKALDAVFIPPGHEELFATMLGRGATLPAGCAFASGQIEHAVVRGIYVCSGAEVVLELRHPSAAPADAARTDKMAIVTTRGTPPAPLLAALQARVREREGAFEWPKVEKHRPTNEPGCKTLAPLPSFLDPYFPGCYPRSVAVLIGLAQIGVMALGVGYGVRRLLHAPRVTVGK